MSDDKVILHSGVLEKSGRYPWGSGGRPYQRLEKFLNAYQNLVAEGLSDKEIAKVLDMSMVELRNRRAYALEDKFVADRARALELMNGQGMSAKAAAEKMGMSYSTFRDLVSDSIERKNQQITNTSNLLKKKVDDGFYVDVGPGTELYIGVNKPKFDAAIQKLIDSGDYEKVNISVKQMMGDGDVGTTLSLLVPVGVTGSDVHNNLNKISMVGGYTDDRGTTFREIEPPRSVSSKEVSIKYAEDGGGKADGLIEIRPGVNYLNMGNSNYAQVRILVNGSHYLKGMAVYNDDLPEGVNLRFNTSKHKGTPMMADDGESVLKKIKEDQQNPFGTTVHQKYYIGEDGKKHLSSLNIVREEGSWDSWSRSIASQVLSKQPPSVAKRQLELTKDFKKEELEDIKSIKNPTVRKRLLLQFADGADSDAVELSAAALPRTNWKVILPVSELKDDEVYAPGYRNGETVVLIRYPHGGKFEMPELKVNNRSKFAQKVMGKNPEDAIGINSKVAEQMSGADFDGDAVLVIPNNDGKLKASKPYKSLLEFDPVESYKIPEGSKAKPLKEGPSKDRQMGVVTNLITDMTVKGAPPSDIIKAVKHSMVVIDSAKHNLDWKQSEKDNDIAKLKARYQPEGGVSTLITRSKSRAMVPERKADGSYKIDPKTGEKIWNETGRTYKNKDGQTVQAKSISTRMAEAKDARELSSGQTIIENHYADYANSMKALGNEARKEYLSTPKMKYDPHAAKTYKKQVDSLNAKLNSAKKNKPLERKAQAIANEVYDMAEEEHYRQTGEKFTKEEASKRRARYLGYGRAQTSSNQSRRNIDVTPDEWEAIQNGAISETKLNEILDYTNDEVIKKYALPRESTKLPVAKKNIANNMLINGYTYDEIADRLGVSVGTIKNNTEKGAK